MTTLIVKDIDLGENWDVKQHFNDGGGGRKMKGFDFAKNQKPLIIDP